MREAIIMQSACNQHATSLHSAYAIRGHQGTVDASTSSAPQLLIALKGWLGSPSHSDPDCMLIAY